MDPVLIGINGKAESGKDTTADFIEQWCAAYDSTVAREAFARRLKESAAHALGVMENEVEFCNSLKGDYERCHIQVRMATPGSGPNKVVAEMSGREYLQFYGTEAHRNVFGSDFWVDAVLPTTEGKLGAYFESDGDSASSTPIPDWHENFLVPDENCAIKSLFLEGKGKWLPAEYCLITDVRFDNEAQRIKDLGGRVWKIEREGAGAGNHASEQELPMELVDVVIDNNGTLDDLRGSVDALMDDLSGVAAAEAALLAAYDEEPING